MQARSRHGTVIRFLMYASLMPDKGVLGQREQQFLLSLVDGKICYVGKIRMGRTSFGGGDIKMRENGFSADFLV